MNTISSRAFLSALLLLLMADSVNAGCYSSRLPVVVEVKMRDAGLEEAMACIKAAALTQKGYENIPLNFVVVGALPDTAIKLSLALKDVPLQRVLEELARTFGLRLRIEPYAVVLVGPGAVEPIRTRTYRVPPDFIQTGSAAK